MSNIEPGVLTDLTAARIRRAARRTLGPAIGEETAREDAAVLHDIIACVRQAYAVHPKPYPEFEVDHLTQTILRAAANVWPEDRDAAASEGEWIMDLLTYTEELMGRDDLYERYLQVCGHVENFDYSWAFDRTNERPSDEDPSVEGVTFEDEVALEDEVVLEDDKGH